MANKRSKREIRFKLNDDDYKAFGRYRIIYTSNGRRLVNRQRITYLISGIMIAVLFTIFPVDDSFTKLAYIVAAVIGIGGTAVSERLVLRQQDRAIEEGANSVERVHPEENTIVFGDETFDAKAGEDEQSFKYSDIKLIDLTEEAIYVWMSDTMIMPVPLHAFSGMDEMKATYKWIKEKIREQGGEAGAEDK